MWSELGIEFIGALKIKSVTIRITTPNHNNVVSITKINEDKIMKKIASICAGLLLIFSTAVISEEHADAALEHANTAVEHGKAGHAPILVEHAKVALEHALAASLVAHGQPKTHLDAAAKSLQDAIDHGNLGHADKATKSAEEAVEHIKAGNK